MPSYCSPAMLADTSRVGEFLSTADGLPTEVRPVAPCTAERSGDSLTSVT